MSRTDRASSSNASVPNNRSTTGQDVAPTRPRPTHQHQLHSDFEVLDALLTAHSNDAAGRSIKPRWIRFSLRFIDRPHGTAGGRVSGQRDGHLMTSPRSASAHQVSISILGDLFDGELVLTPKELALAFRRAARREWTRLVLRFSPTTNTVVIPCRVRGESPLHAKFDSVHAVIDTTLGTAPAGTRRIYRAQAGTKLLSSLVIYGRLTLQAGRWYSSSDFAHDQPAVYFHEDLSACVEWMLTRYHFDPSIVVCDLPQGLNYQDLCSVPELYHHPEGEDWRRLVKAHRNPFDRAGIPSPDPFELIYGPLMGTTDADGQRNIDFRTASPQAWEAWTPAPDSRLQVNQLCFRSNQPLSRLIVRGVVILRPQPRLDPDGRDWARDRCHLGTGREQSQRNHNT